MRRSRPVLLIERAAQYIKPAHWPFRGSWTRSVRRGRRTVEQIKWTRRGARVSLVQRGQVLPSKNYSRHGK